jgi:hypothetical protein
MGLPYGCLSLHAPQNGRQQPKPSRLDPGDGIILLLGQLPVPRVQLFDFRIEILLSRLQLLLFRLRHGAQLIQAHILVFLDLCPFIIVAHIQILDAALRPI